MTRNENIAVVSLVTGIIIGCVIGGSISDGYYKRKAIENGAAHYDRVSGNWEWNK